MNATEGVEFESTSTEEAVDLIDESVIGQYLYQWRFFSPSVDLTKRIWQLNDRLGTDYFDNELKKLTEHEPEMPELSEATEDPNWLKRILARVSEIVFHEDERSGGDSNLSDDEFTALLQKVISERIYNHLAMLFRSPHAKKGGAFSVREELTEGMVEKIGLGLCLHAKTNDILRADCEAALNDLAAEFQKWFIEEEKGMYPTVWGEICASNVEMPQNGRSVLILEPDVQSGGWFAVGR